MSGLCLRAGLSLLPVAYARLAGPQAPEDSALLASHLAAGVRELQMQDLPWLHPGSGEPSCGPISCPAGTLSTEPSPQPLELIFNVYLQSFNSVK